MILPRSLTDRIRSATGGMPRAFWVLWTGTLVNRMGTFVLPFLAIYLTRERGYSVTQAGMVSALYGAGSAIAAPLGGYLADHVGRRFTMVTALGLGGLGMIGLGFAHRIEVFAPACFFLSVVSEMYRPAMFAAIVDLAPSAERVRAYGLVYWAINLGFAIGLALGGVLATISFLLLFVGDGVTTLVFALLVWRGVPETRPAHRASDGSVVRAPGGFFAAYRDPMFLGFLALSFFYAVLIMQHALALPLDMTAHGVSKAAFGVVMAMNGVVIVLVQPWLSPILTRRDRSRTIAAGATLTAVGFGLNAIAGSVPMYAAGVVIWTIGEICVLPVANSVVGDLAPTHIRGRYQGAYNFSFGLAVCAAPAAGSFVYQQFGAAPLWYGCLVVGLLVAFGQLALAPLRRARTVAAARTPAA